MCLDAGYHGTVRSNLLPQILSSPYLLSPFNSAAAPTPACVCASSARIYYLRQTFISDSNVVAPFNRLISRRNPQFLNLLLAISNEINLQWMGCTGVNILFAIQGRSQQAYSGFCNSEENGPYPPHSC